MQKPENLSNYKPNSDLQQENITSNQDFENELDIEMGDMKNGNFFEFKNQKEQEYQKKVSFEKHESLDVNEENELKIQLSNISNCEDERLNENGGTILNYMQNKQTKNFQDLSSIGSDTRKEVQDFIEGHSKFDPDNQDEIEEGYSEEDYYDEEGSNENEGALDKTVILEQGVYESIIKEEPQSTKRMKKHKNSNARRASRQEQKLLRVGMGDETRKIGESQAIQDDGLRITFGPESMKTKVAILSQEISPIEAALHDSEFKDYSSNIQFNNEEQPQQQQTQHITQDDDTKKTVITLDSQLNQKNGIQQDTFQKTDSSLTINQVQIPEVIETTDNQPKDEESKEVHEDNKSKEGGLQPTDEENDEDETAEQKVVFVSPTGRFKRFSDELGRGAYKSVYRGFDHDTGREIAWSLINISNLPKSERPRIKSEIQLIKQLDHPNIITFISAWITQETQQIHFITEMITGGSLRQYLKKIGYPKLKVIKKWCHEILQGLNYLHTQKIPIIHRDIKCDNIFVNSNSGEIKIGDLGLSTTMKDSYTSSVLGTPEFMAPELYEEHYGTEVDIYAFGMAVLEMLTQEAPYRECQNPAQIYRKVVNRDFPKSLERINDPQVYKFITWCLEKRQNRPTAEQLLQSEFMNDNTSANNDKPVSLFETHKIPPKLFKHLDLNGSLEGIPEQEEPCSQVMTGKIQTQDFQSSANNETFAEFHSQPQYSQNLNTQGMNHIQISQNKNEDSQKEINLVHVEINISQQNLTIDNDKQMKKNEEKQIEKYIVNQEQSKSLIQEKHIQQEEKSIQNAEKNIKIQENLHQNDQSDLQSQNENSILKNPQDNETDQNISLQNVIFQKKDSINIESQDKSPRFFSKEKTEIVDSQSLKQGFSNNGQKNEQTFQFQKAASTFQRDIALDIQLEQNQQSINQNIEEGQLLEKQQQQIIKSKIESIQKQQSQDLYQNSPDRLPEKKTSSKIDFQNGSPLKRKVEKHMNQSLQENIKVQSTQEEQTEAQVKTIFQQLQEENKSDSKKLVIQVQNSGQQTQEDQQKKERQKYKEETLSSLNFVIQNKTNVSHQNENLTNQNPSQQNSHQQAQKVKEESQNQISYNLSSISHRTESQQNQSASNQISHSSQINNFKEETQNQNQTNSQISESQSSQSPPLKNLSSSQAPLQQKIAQNVLSLPIDISLQQQQLNQFDQPQESQKLLDLQDKSIKRNEENMKHPNGQTSHHEKEKLQAYPYKKEFKEDKDDKDYQPRSQIVDTIKLNQKKKNSSSSGHDVLNDSSNQNKDQQNQKLEERQALHKSNKELHNQNQKLNTEPQKQHQIQRSRSVSVSSNNQQTQNINLNQQQNKQSENKYFEQFAKSISIIESQQDQITDKSEVGSCYSRDLGGLMQQMNQFENKNDIIQNHKNFDKSQQSLTQTKSQIQQKPIMNIQLTSSIKQNQRKIKIEPFDRNEFKKKMQTALKPKNDKKQAEFVNQQPIQIGLLKDMSTRENMRKQTNTSNNYGLRKDQTRSVPPMKSPRSNKNNQISNQEPKTTKITSNHQIDNHVSTQKQKESNINLGNQTSIMCEIPKIENLEILAMTVNFGDNVVTFEFCLGRDTPEQVANDFAGQMDLDIKHQNQFCKEIHENLKKHQVEKKKCTQQRGRNGSGQTTKEKQIDHQKSFLNSQYPQIFSDYQQNNIIPIKNDISKTLNYFPQERGEKTNEKLIDNVKLNEKIILQQNEDHPIHKSMRQSMLEMNNNNTLCETKEVQKASNDNESLQWKKQIVKEAIIKVTGKRGNNFNSSSNSLQQNDQQPKNGKEFIKKIISPENIQFKDVKQYKVTNSNNQNQQQSTQQRSPTNNIQIQNQEMSINIQEIQKQQNISQVKKNNLDHSPQLDSRIAQSILQKQQKLQNLFKNMKNSIRDFFEDINPQEISEVTQIIGKSEQFQTVQLQNEFIQNLKEIHIKYLVQKDLQKDQLKDQPKDQNPAQLQTLNNKIIQATNLQQIGKSPQTQSNIQTQKIRTNKESFNSIQQQLVHPLINNRALQEKSKSLIKRVQLAVKEGINLQKMESVLKDKNNIILAKKESQNDQTVEITDNSSIKASAGSSSSSIMTASFRASIHAENMRNLLPLLDEDNENNEVKIVSNIKILQGKLELAQDGVITQELNQKIEQYLKQIEFKNQTIADLLKHTNNYSNFKQKPRNQQPNNQQNGGIQLQKLVPQNEKKQKKQGQSGSQSFVRQKSLQPGGEKRLKTLFAEQNKKN